MQVKKLKQINTKMCDRFVYVWVMSGLTLYEFAHACGLGFASSIIEIKNYATEPSKKMILSLYEKLGVNPNFILVGVGGCWIRNGRVTPAVSAKEIADTIRDRRVSENPEHSRSRYQIAE